MPNAKPSPNRGRVIALLGSESTGKTTLAREMSAALIARGHAVALVEEFLREFCDTQGRIPRRDEQRAIAAEQTLRIERAAARHDFVVTDTTALMVAVYSDLVFGDHALYDSALHVQARYDLNLLTAVDLPWQADGHQRDGEHVQASADERVREALARAQLPFSVVCGSGPTRLSNALASARRVLGLADEHDAPPTAARWTWRCERCGDPDCERHLLPR